MIECRERLHADADVAAQIPSAGIAAGRLLIDNLRSRRGMSAACAVVLTMTAASAAKRYFTLTICFVLFPWPPKCGPASLNEAKGVRKFLNAS